MHELRTKADLQALVDNKVQESLTLDYKASPALAKAKADEICKDVSAFANSAGGRLIYGLPEDRATRLPRPPDDGADAAEIRPEWLEQTISSRIQPRIPGVVITPIPFLPDGSRLGYVIDIPQSLVGPHQAPDNKYYRRFNFQSVPMEDYEVKDVFRRATTPALNLQAQVNPRLSFGPGAEVSRPHGVHFAISNESAQPAFYSVISVFIDTRIEVANNGEFTPAAQTQLKRRPAHVLIRRFGIPDDFPVFRELAWELSQVDLIIPLGGDHTFQFAWEINTPGFSRRREGVLLRNGGNMSFVWDDGHPD